jgi:hypothetical protein
MATEALEAVPQRVPSLHLLRVVLAKRKQHPDERGPTAGLRPRVQGPSRGTGNRRENVAPPHPITSMMVEKCPIRPSAIILADATDARRDGRRKAGELRSP